MFEYRIVEKKPTYKSAAVLEYDAVSMEAPYISAQGEEMQADLIVRLARRYGVPVVERPEVARVLSLGEEGTTIPEQLYKAVALVLNEVEAAIKRRANLLKRYRAEAN